MSSRGVIRIVIADSQPIYRLGIKTLLRQQPGFALAGEAHDGEQALDLVAKLRPDVLLLDAGLPLLSGMQVLERLAKTRSATRTIVVTAAMHEADIQTALFHGAWGVVLKNTATEKLTRCIKQVMEGERCLEHDTAHNIGPVTRSKTEVVLTQREAEIAKRIAKGASNKEVASDLGLGEQTVKNYLRRIFQKLKVTNRLELAMQFAALERLSDKRARREQ